MCARKACSGRFGRRCGPPKWFSLMTTVVLLGTSARSAHGPPADLLREWPIREMPSNETTMSPENDNIKIYVYDLPAEFSFEHKNLASMQGWETMYLPEFLFVADVMRDAKVRARDPAEADFFLIPAMTAAYMHESKSRRPGDAMDFGEGFEFIRRVVRYVANTFPYFNASGGSDHLLVLAQDLVRACYRWKHPGSSFFSRSERLTPITHLVASGFFRETETFKTSAKRCVSVCARRASRHIKTSSCLHTR